MNVNGVSNNDTRMKTNVKAALGAGAACAGIKTIFLPREEKALFRIALSSKDSFIKRAINDLKKSEVASQLTENDISAAKGVIEENFDAIKTTAKEISKQTLKNLGKTFAFMAGAVFAGNLISDVIAANRAKSANKPEKAN